MTVTMKAYVDALNREKRRTGNWRTVAVVGTLGAMIFGIFRATGVLAQTFEKRMDTTNEWRGTLEDQNKSKATVQQFEQLKEQLDEVRKDLAANKNRASGSNMLWQIIASVLGGAATILIILTALGKLHG